MFFRFLAEIRLRMLIKSSQKASSEPKRENSVPFAPCLKLQSAWTSGGTIQNWEEARSWADLSLKAGFEKLIDDNVVVTNQSDKLVQIARLKFLEKNSLTRAF